MHVVRIDLGDHVPPVLVVIVHLHSRRNREASTLTAFSFDRIREIREVESQLDTRNTVVVGDFNMNPFDAGMIGAHGFHATMDPSRQSRILNGRHYDHFYNPMWKCMGGSPLGTHYHSQSGENELFWHTLDQILVRPALKVRGVRIIDELGDVRMVHSRGLDPALSDHLPVVADIEVEGGQRA